MGRAGYVITAQEVSNDNPKFSLARRRYLPVLWSAYGYGLT